MIILDTNVLSELMKPAPSARVVRWVGAQPTSSLFVTSVTQAEILYGIALMPAGRRRTAVNAAAVGMFGSDFEGRILGFGSDAAQVYAEIVAGRRRGGRPISHLDAQIAAIARCAGAAIATRNVVDFERCGVKNIDPWDA
jgi:predicted nucleic acid-binding protein